MTKFAPVLRTRHYSYQTEQTYLKWICRYIFFHNVKHPAEIGKTEVEAFLSHLAVEGNVSASTQNQALFALLFLYKEVLKTDLPWLDEFTPAKKSSRVPVVLTKEEVKLIIKHLTGTNWLIANFHDERGIAPARSVASVSQGFRFRISADCRA